MACLTSMIEPLRAANEIADTRSFAWTLISEDGGPVESSAAVAFHPNCTLVGAGHLDYLFLLSPPNGRFTDPRKGNGALAQPRGATAPLWAASAAVCFRWRARACWMGM